MHDLRGVVACDINISEMENIYGANSGRKCRLKI